MHFQSRGFQYARTRDGGRPDVDPYGEMVAIGPVSACMGELKRGSLGPIGAVVPERHARTDIVDFYFIFSISGGRIG